MPKVILEYQLPEELDEYETAMKGGNYHYILDEIKRYVRSLSKYDERELIPIEELADKINELTADF